MYQQSHPRHLKQEARPMPLAQLQAGGTTRKLHTQIWAQNQNLLQKTHISLQTSSAESDIKPLLEEEASLELNIRTNWKQMVLPVTYRAHILVPVQLVLHMTLPGYPQKGVIPVPTT